MNPGSNLFIVIFQVKGKLINLLNAIIRVNLELFIFIFFSFCYG